MKTKMLIAASLIALGNVPYLAQGQVGTQDPRLQSLPGQPSGEGQGVQERTVGQPPTQANLNALPPALRAALLSGNAATIEAAINALSGGNAAQAGNLAGQVARAAEALAQTNPAAAAAAARAAVSVASQPSVLAANPAAAAQVAQQAMRIASNPAVVAAAPQFAGQIAMASRQIAASPVVVAAVPTIAAAILTSVGQVANNPIIAAAVPQLAGLAQQQPAQPQPFFAAPIIPQPQPVFPPSCGASCAS